MHRITIGTAIITLCITLTCKPMQRTTEQEAARLNRYQVEDRLIQSNAMNNNWRRMAFADFIPILKPDGGDTKFVIKWCNAALDGMKNDFYHEKNQHELVAKIAARLKHVSTNPEFQRVLHKHNRHTGILSELQTQLHKQRSAYNAKQLCHILNNIIETQAPLRRDVIDSWQTAFKERITTHTPDDNNIAITISHALQLLSKHNIQPRHDVIQTINDAIYNNITMFRARELVNSLYGYARLGITPDEPLMTTWYHHATYSLTDCKPQELSNSIYALYMLNCTPDSTFLRTWFTTTYNRLDTFNLLNATHSIFACAKLGIHPDRYMPGWTRQFFDATYNKLHTTDTQQISNLIYACGILSVTPNADWLQQYLQRTCSAIPHFQAQHLSNSMYGFSQLGISPEQYHTEWMNTWYQTCIDQISHFSPQDVSNSLYAISNLGIQPPHEWMECILRRTLDYMHTLTPQHLSNTMYSCAKLRANPETYTPEWIEAWTSASRSCIDDVTPQGLALMCLSCAKLRVHPDSYDSLWISTHKAAVDNTLPSWTTQDVASTVYAYGRLRIAPSQQLCSQVTQQMDAYNMHEIANILYGLTLSHAVTKDPILQTTTHTLIEQRLKNPTYMRHTIDTANSIGYRQLRWALLYFGYTQMAQHIPQTHIDEHSSELEQEVNTSLEHLWKNGTISQPHAPYYIPKLDTTVDFAWPDKKVICEVDGIYHFFTRDNTYIPKDTVKNHLLETSGWTVLRVPYMQWRACHDGAAYLQSQLAHTNAINDEPPRKAAKR